MELAVNGGLVGLTIGLTQVFKKYVSEKYVPLLALTLGLGFSLLVNGVSAESALIGLTIGLSASGVYDNAKKLTE